MPASFLHRLRLTVPLLAAWYAAGLVIAWWDPQPGLILTVALGATLGMLLLGPYAAVLLYTFRLQQRWRGHLRWPLCLVLVLLAVLLMGHALDWTWPQAGLAGTAALLGMVLGHDATLAALEVKATPGRRLDRPMLALFPLLLGLAALGGYCSLGFAAGSYRLLLALLG